MDFSHEQLRALEDGEQAITACGLWEWLRDFTPHPNEGFLLTYHPNLLLIYSKLKHQPSSGIAFAWIMNALKERAVRTGTPPCPCRRERGIPFGWCGVAGGGVPACEH